MTATRTRSIRRLAHLSEAPDVDADLAAAAAESSGPAGAETDGQGGGGGVRDALSRRRRASAPHPRLPRVVVLVGSLLLLVALIGSVRAVDADSASDIAGTLSRVVTGIARWRWQFTALVMLAAGAHYAASAVAARAASGLALPLAEAGLVQLAAAAANRISAAGLGGSAVNIRYFTRRGLLPSTATGAVAALGLLGGFADLLILAGITLIGPSLGLAGAGTAFTQAGLLLSTLVSPLTSMWAWACVVLLITLIAVLVLRGRSAQILPALSRVWEPTAVLLRSPGRLATLLAASAATTLILAFAFVASVRMVPGPTGHLGVAALVVSFMLGSAAGNVVPVPAGVGSTEAALVAVLVAGGIPAMHAVGIVLAYRAVTFWLPPALGLLALRRLVRLGVL